MDTKYLKNVALYILSALLSFAIIGYVVYELYKSINTEIVTILTEKVTERDTKTLDAYILRDEEIVYSETDGGVNYLYDNGEKVGINTAIANIYNVSDESKNESDSIRTHIISIDKKINILENSNIGENIILSDTTAIDNRINELYNVICSKVSTGDINYALRKKDELLTLMNKRQIIVRSVKNFDDRISVLENEKTHLNSGLENIVETISTGMSGYFYAEIDGYEKIFSSKKVNGLTLDQFEKMKSSEPDPLLSHNIKGYSIGKLAVDYKWYIASSLTKSQLKDFREGFTYSVIFPYSEDTEIKMTLERIVQQTDDENVILIFSTGYIPENFNFLRRQTVEVVQNSYEGYKIPISAVRIVNGIQGVYTLDGNTVVFKEIVPLLETNGYLIVGSQNQAEDSNYYKKLALYDRIITKGKNLYDGKIID